MLGGGGGGAAAAVAAAFDSFDLEEAESLDLLLVRSCRERCVIVRSALMEGEVDQIQTKVFLKVFMTKEGR